MYNSESILFDNIHEGCILLFDVATHGDHDV